MWSNRVSDCSSIGDVVRLHDERFRLWSSFISSFCEKNGCTMVKEERPQSRHSFEMAVVALGNSFAKKTLIKYGKPMFVFDASFGSLDPTSDLDVVVVGTSTDVISDWITWLQKQHVGNTDIFSLKYDSNFYFEPGEVVHDQLIPKVQSKIAEMKSSKATMVSEMKLIEKYASAYINKTTLQISDYSVYPNPSSPGFGQTAEIEQYRAMLYASNKCLSDFNTINLSELACTKSEGLISAGSLAICGVFGPKIQNEFIMDNDRGQPWRLVAALEMLYNLKMHEHGNKVKTKYLVRLDNVLRNGRNACRRPFRGDVSAHIASTKDDFKEISLVNVIDYINVIVEDEHDFLSCPLKVPKRSLEKNIEIVKMLIISYANASKTIRRATSFPGIYRTHVKSDNK